MLGRSDAAACGAALSDLAHPRDQAVVREALRSLANGRTETSDVEGRYLHADGSIVFGRTMLSAVRDAAGALRYVVVLVEDITPRKRAEAKARRALARHRAIADRVARLTDRERQVLWLLVEGKATKVIASELGASPKTIEVHRGRVMEKMEADSVARLVQMAMRVRHLGPG
jgi:PAS domain S-box-containing protein